jgi:predicted metalloprotease with PDZ domain
MRHRSRLVVYAVALLVATALAAGQKSAPTLAFTVSMDQPGAHLYHVVLRSEGLEGATQHFKLPVWSPGYYAVMDFAKNVRDFHAETGDGTHLDWQKAAPNDWAVHTANAAVVVVTYDVLASSTFAANPYVGDDRGLIVGTGVFMYVAGQVARPVTVEITLNPAWHTIATGLDPVSPDKPRIFAAPNFDVLYDSPILMGNLDSLPSFQVKGVPHSFVGYKLGDGFDRDRFMSDLRAIVEQAVAIIGDIPYTHYTFLGIGPGQGGIEHLNSTVVPFTGGAALDTRQGRIRELSFLAHEYFHNYNVKRIRPVALGPFDYDGPNLTNMLWVSEGFTVYYEYLLLARAGLMNQDELLDAFRKDIAAYENNTGHLFQSATTSSHDTWTQGPFGGRGRGGISKSISYYNKGSALGLLLDFKIRHETRNRKSLDTVMRTLYQRFYKKLARGWTDEEFRAVCEEAAGVPLAENFTYASTTKDIDYDKYLGYAGLELEKPTELPDAYLGVVAEDVDGMTVVSAIEKDSPAAQAHLAVKDHIKAVDGAAVDAQALDKLIAARKPGDTMSLTLVRAGKDLPVSVVLGHKLQRSYKIVPIAHPDALQSAILADWAGARNASAPSAAWLVSPPGDSTRLTALSILPMRRQGQASRVSR